MHGDYLLLSATHLLTALGFAALVSRQDPLRDTDAVRSTRAADVESGFLCFALVSALDYRKVARAGLSYLPLVGALALSVVLILFGSGPAGSNAKVNLGPLQPIEFIRLLLALFLAGYFARRWEAASRRFAARTFANVAPPSLAQRAARGLRAARRLPAWPRRWCSSFCRRISGRRSSCRASS